MKDPEGSRYQRISREVWAERMAIMITDGGLPREEAERLALWAGQASQDGVEGRAAGVPWGTALGKGDLGRLEGVRMAP